jgi:hypothetical protein
MSHPKLINSQEPIIQNDLFNRWINSIISSKFQGLQKQEHQVALTQFKDITLK